MPRDKYVVIKTDDEWADAYDYPVEFKFTGNWESLADGNLSKLVHVGKDG
jgi:hypothetical protein